MKGKDEEHCTRYAKGIFVRLLIQRFLMSVQRSAAVLHELTKARQNVNATSYYLKLVSTPIHPQSRDLGLTNKETFCKVTSVPVWLSFC